VHDAADDVLFGHALHVGLAVRVHLEFPVIVIVEFVVTVAVFVLFIFILFLAVEQFLVEGLRTAILPVEFHAELGVRFPVVPVGVPVPVEFIAGIQRAVGTIRRATVLGERRPGGPRTVRRGGRGRRCNADGGCLSGNGR
jgi:hypothetical protein